jgi:hypothetical protein
VSAAVVLLALLALAASPAGARSRRHHRRPHTTPAASSLYAGPGPRPGPPILYEAPATAPELTNAGVWHAKPILVSGSEAYRQGEFLYQDFLYDDDGAHELLDPTDPRLSAVGDLFSMTNGTYTYPTRAGYDENAADLVEFRAKPLASATAFRVTLNTLTDPALVAFSIAIGGSPGMTYPFPDGANVVAPASLFLTVHEVNGALAAQLVHAGSDTPVAGPAPSVSVDLARHQIQVEVPHTDWSPGGSTVRLAMGVGLWNAASNSYLLPQTLASATRPGGGGLASHPAGFFNVAFRTSEPEPSVTSSANAVIDAAWWRDKDQGAALAAGNISAFHADVNFSALRRGVTDNSQVPKTGSFDMILPSHFSLGQGESFTHACGFFGSANPASCQPEYLGNLQPYNIYVPPGAAPRGGYGLTLLLHSLSANYNQFMGSRNQSQFGQRPRPSIVITPESRGPDQFYAGLGGAEVFETWAVVAHMYRLDPAYTDIAGYSMGGFGTFRLAAQFPDLFSRAQPTVGEESDQALLASLRNVPLLMWNNLADELVGPELYLPDEQTLASDGDRFELDAYRPCLSLLCSPLFPDHLELAVNDEYAPAAAFLGTATVDRNPAHVTYVVDPGRDAANYGVVADHAYWISGLTVRGAAQGEIDARSHGFGTGDPKPSGISTGLGMLTGGNMGPIQYLSFRQTWGAVPSAPRSDAIDITATDLATASIDVARARVDCRVTLNITSKSPLTVTLPGCDRVVHAG